MAVPVMPSTAQYGYVVGRFLLAVGDTAADPDSLPDAIVPSGYATLTPIAPITLFPTSNPPVTVLPQPIRLNLDADGDIVDPSGNQGAWLIVGQYEVDFSFVGVSVNSFIITVTTAHTQLAPLDLTLAAPLPSSPAVVFVVNAQVQIDTFAARDAAIAARDSTISGLATKAPLDSPTFTGSPTVPTPAVGDSDFSIPNTAWVTAAIATITIADATSAIKGKLRLAGDLAGTADSPQLAVSGVTAAVYGSASLIPVLTVDAKGRITSATTAAWNPMTAVGDLLVGSTAGAPSRLAGNTLTSKRFLAGVGTGSAAAAPTWSTIAESDVTNLVSDLALKANLAGPAFTGVPTAPTAAGATSTTQIATTAYVRGEIATLIGTAPSTLDTFQELAAQMQSDESGVAALTTTVGTKAPIDSPTFTGTPNAPVPSDVNSTGIANVGWTLGKLGAYAPIASPTFTGTPLAPTPASITDATTKIATTAWVRNVIGDPQFDLGAAYLAALV